MTDNSGPFGPVIYAYSRAQAIEDGVLVDVTETAKEAGFKHPTCVTAAVWAMIQPSPELVNRLGCDVNGRLWDVCFMAMFAIKAGTAQRLSPSDMIFEVILPQHPRDPEEVVKLKFSVGPGDTPDPVITIMKTDED